jgi:glyoxylase-like metal-dependent hydrolase (beta-lactamase superfamily II)
MKQEQEEARASVTEVAPDVLRMELPISMPGLGHVNCYALLDGEGAALMDPGLPGPETQDVLIHRLAQAGLRETDVHTVIITHSHPDHFGCANWLQKVGGARIVAYKSFGWGIGLGPHGHDHEVSLDDLRAHADAVEPPEPEESLEERWQRRRERLSPWGGSPLGVSLEGRESRVAEMMGSGKYFPEISHPVADGDVLRLGGREWFVRFTPGHTSDHFCLHSPELEVLLSGDHVLPSITPHIAGTGAHADPLKLYMEALDQVAALEHVSTVLPAHGHPFDNLSERTQVIKRHHFERLDHTKQIGGELGAASVEAFSQRLFPERSWGMMAESETYAHLEHLRHAREAECHSEDGKLLYVIR